MKEQLIEEIERLRQEVDKLRQEKTERKRARERTQHLNLVLRGIRNVNQLIVREKDRSRLLKGICASLTESHGYYNAWVALLDESGRLIAHAESGLGADFLPMKERLVRGKLTHCAQKALKQSGPVITKNPTLNCSDCPLSAKYSGRGGMTIGLQRNGKSYGILCTSVPADLVEDEEECLFFQEVAGDIAFALHDLELEERYAQSEHDVKKRVKELECLYGIAAIAEKPGITLDELYQEVANLLPSSWQYPEICCARITIEDKEFRTANYRDTKWKLCSDIKLGGVKAGAVEVNYLEKRPELDEGPFLREERRLIDAVAERVGRITEHKRHEKAYKQLIDGMNDTTFVIDFKGKFLDVNDTAIKTLGYSRTELLTMGPVDIDPYLSPDDIGKLIEGMKLDERQVFESQHRTKDGKIIPVEISSSPVSYQGKAAILSVARDLTERKRAEEELRKAMGNLERFNRLAVGREQRMIELKHEVNDLLHSLGRQEKYRIPTLENDKNKKGR